jgi:hypothetical protein
MGSRDWCKKMNPENKNNRHRQIVFKGEAGTAFYQGCTVPAVSCWVLVSVSLRSGVVPMAVGGGFLVPRD